MSNWRIPWFVSFTKSERRRLNIITNIYQECINPNIPNEFILESNKPLHVASERDWTPETWVGKMGRGMLKPSCEAMIILICEYQVVRSNRWFGNGYRNDPYVLFLEELKGWLSKTVSFLDLNIDALKQVENRIRYLEHILAEPELFDPFPAHNMTMQQVVYHSRKVLKYEMLPMIETEIANSSAREDLRQLQKSVRSALDQLVKFLYHIFRDEGPKNITITGLRQPSGDKYAKIPATSSGFILHQLVSSGIFTSIFQDSHYYFEDATKEVSKGMSELNSSVVSANEFLDEKGNVKLPLTLFKFLQPDNDLKKILLINLENCFDHESSGFESYFRGKGMISATYLKCFGLCQELAKFVLICENAHRLAGQGGDLLVYGIANAQVNSMVSTYMHLTHALRMTVDRLNQIAEIRFEKLVNRNQAREASNSWVKHYKKISYVMEQMTLDLDAGDVAAMHVRAKANSMTLNERLKKAKQDTENFVFQADSYSRHVSGLLGIDYAVPKIPSSVSTIKAIRGNNYNAFDSIIATEATLEDSNTASPSPVVKKANLQIESSPKNPLHNDDKELVLVKQGIETSNMNRIFVHLTPNLTKLSLENNKIDGEGVYTLLEHLNKFFPNIHSINLYHNELGSEGARALSEIITRPHYTLQALDINSNDIGNEGSKYIINALTKNTSITELDLGSNGITDTGIVNLADALESPNLALKFLNLSGNNISSRTLKFILPIFEEKSNIIEINVGDANDKIPEELASKFRTISYARKAEHHKKLLEEYEEAQKKQKESEMKLIEAAKDEDAKTSEEQKSSSKPKKTKKTKKTDQKEASSSKNTEMVETEDDEVEIQEPELQVAEFYPLIRAIQILSTPLNRTVERSKLDKVFKYSIYGVQLPRLSMTTNEYFEAAQTQGIIELRFTTENRSPYTILLSLKDDWKEFKVPAPEIYANIDNHHLKLFMSCCKQKPNEAHRKRSNFVPWFKQLKPELIQVNEENLLLVVDFAVYVGILVKDSSGKFKPNLIKMKYPIDTGLCKVPIQ